MKLHLIRHAKTKENAPSGLDFDRELKSVGKEDAARLVTYLKSIDFTADKTLCSTAKRTRQTLAILEKELEMGTIQFSDDLYLASEADLRSQIEHCRTEENLVLVGHNDGISDLANYLTGQTISLPTSAYLCIEFFIDEWCEISKDTGMIIDFYRPA